MKKRKNAFTLIELLAVIVILAVIALIATPIILGIVEDAKKDAFLRSVELVISTTDIDIANKTFENEYTYTITNGNISNLEVSIKNTDGMNGNITYDLEGKEIYAIHNGVYCVMKTSDMSKAEISDYKEGECRIIIPTSEKCFAYEPVYEYEIIDVNKCIEFLVNEVGNSEEVATSICNNEPHEWNDGKTLTEYLPSNLSFAESLLESGAVSRTQLSEVFIVDYYNNEENDSNKPACPRDVVIPNSINGVSITQIGDEAFRRKEIESVVFPKSITTIRKGAFAENKLTGELDLSNTVVTIIDGNAFSGDNDENNNLITSVKFPNTLESIGRGAFSYNPIKKIDMSYTNVEIGDAAFCEHNLSKTSQEYQNISNINSEALTCPL